MAVGVEVTPDVGDGYTMIYAASKYNDDYSAMNNIELEQAIIRTDLDDDTLHQFDDYYERIDNHVFVTNAGNDHLAFTEGGYQVAFMGDGDDQLYVNTNTYGTNNYYFADMGNEVYSLVSLAEVTKL